MSSAMCTPGTGLFCCDPRRKSAVEASSGWNGIDFVHVLDDPAAPVAERQTTLLIYFIHELAAGSLSTANVRIEGGERIRNIAITQVEVAPTLTPPGSAAGTPPTVQPKVLRVRVAAPGDFSWYTLRLVKAPDDAGPPTGIDRVLASIDFTFKAGCAGGFDCADTRSCPPEPSSMPRLNYLARDYTSFRQLMLDRLALTTPGWVERNPADVGLAIVELLAYVADRLAYEQDAIATEAYLGTARLRSSVRRHARLIDYPMHDGCNARTFVQLRAAKDVSGLTVHRRYRYGDGPYQYTQVLTRCPGLPRRVLALGSPAHRDALNTSPPVFELLHDVTLYSAHNELHFYTWGARECCLPKGATRATLRGDLSSLKVGDILILAEVKSPTNGTPQDADTARRHALKLTRVQPTKDQIGGQFEKPPHNNPVAVTEIEWQVRDALPFALTLASRVATDYHDNLACAYGNIVAVDHGMTLVAEELPPVPGPNEVLVKVTGVRQRACSSSLASATTAGSAAKIPYARFRPRLGTSRTGPAVGPITQACAFDAENPPAAACDYLNQQPGKAVAKVWLAEDSASEAWVARRDLLASTAQDRAFVVEVEQDGRAYLRFGDDEFGMRPVKDTVFKATYRIGNGTAGNVGAGTNEEESTLFHLATADPDIFSNLDSPSIAAVWNPLPARGGVEPETIESVRQRAPSAIRGDIERAVTPADYELLARRVSPSVQRATATPRWTGSWRTLFLSVDRYGAQQVDAPFEADLIAGLERYRLAGHDLEVEAPRYVPLQLKLDVCVQPGFDPTQVEAALMGVLSNASLPGGQRGVFHPDNFSFGQTVYLSPIQAAALSVQGVSSVAVQGFQRQDQPETDGTAEGCLRFARREIPRLDNDRNYPDRGVLELNVMGGR